MLGLKESKWKTNPLVLRILHTASFSDLSLALESCALESY